LNIEGEKVSTSRNWAVWLNEYLEDMPNKQDVLRYVLCSIAPETKDSEFTWKDFQARNNNELVAILGNFVNRTLVLAQKYYDGKVPDADVSRFSNVLSSISKTGEAVSNSVEKYRFREALAHAIDLARTGNQFLAENEPWKLIKTDEEGVKEIMSVALQITANLTIVLDPFLPRTCAKLRELLNIGQMSWVQIGDPAILQAGHQLLKPSLLFARIEDEEIEKQIEKLRKKKID
ncbi:MAG TPA: methionine--tRNA ligase, partial [Flavobacteriales bacterium]|nr:methionine--tRNA ligase [Flavobacteriales bacterium]